MNSPTTVRATYYISSGRKNAMYTLRVERRGGTFASDGYVCNLSTDPDLAEKKGQEFFDRIKDRLGESDSFSACYVGGADFDLFERRGALSVLDTERLELVEAGIMPFGKNEGKRFEDMAMHSVLWFADKSKEEGDSPVFAAVCNACMGVALDKNYIAAREQAQQEAAEAEIARKAASQYLGEVGKRQEFSGKVEAVIFIGARQVAYNTFAEKWLTKIISGDNVIAYFGNKVAEVGEEIKFKATVKAHEVYNETKQTTVARVKVL